MRNCYPSDYRITRVCIPIPILFASTKFAEITADRIIVNVAYFMAVSVSGMKSQSREREVTAPRMMAMYFIKTYFPKLPLKTIGKMFGGRDHSTVINAIATINDLIDTDKDVKKQIEFFKQLFDEKFINAHDTIQSV